MIKYDLAVRANRLVSSRNVAPGTILVQDGTIRKIVPLSETFEARSVVDAGNLAVMPAAVDTHVHFNDPGRADWEGFETGTRAAAAGGIGTVVDMPLNSRPVTTTAEALRVKMNAVAGHAFVDYSFWGGIVPGNEKELGPMAEAGARGFKAFLIDSGLPEYPPVGEEELRRAMKALSRLGLPLLVHAEISFGASPKIGATYSSYLRSRPDAMESEAVTLAARLALETGCRTHIVHLSSAEALKDVERELRAGAPVSFETCPHYLFFDAGEIADGHTEFKCAPPIRGKANADRLWEALGAGAIGMIVSDHSPCAPELKSLKDGNFGAAWGGISSVQFSLRAAWTEATRRGFGLDRLAWWMCEKPADLAGLPHKGKLAPGADADILVWDPEAETSVEASEIEHRHKLTPYLGRKLKGRFHRLFLRGREIRADGRFIGESSGRLLSRETSNV